MWWARIGANIGFEENGKNDRFERPILIVRKFNKDMIWSVPLTSKDRDGEYYYRIHQFFSTAILSQLRLISSKRLVRKMGIVGVEKFSKLSQKLFRLIKTAPFREPRSFPFGKP
ncbi:MAG: type II toxin-antitoxin system PemK/MazF family toxin [Acidobacteriaceae bacterium]